MAMLGHWNFWALRMETLEHLRRSATPTREQTFDWQDFKEKWDDKMAAAHKAEWGE